MSQWVIDNLDNVDLDNTQSQEEQSRKMQSIYKVPPLISDLNKKAYQPHAVSFGPYHYGEPHLKPMEVYKGRALLNFLHKSEVPFSSIFDSMVEVAEELKGSYASLEPKWRCDTRKFVKLMIVDGCFMFSIFWSAKMPFDGDIFVDDPFSGDNEIQYVIPFIKRDMLLLENQLPIRVLLVLLKIITFTLGDDKKNLRILNRKIPSFYGHNPLGPEMGTCLHVLDFYHKSLVYTGSTPTESSKINSSLGPKEWPIVIRSATDLNEANIRFEVSESRSFSDISFDDGVVRLPSFVVNNDTESIFLNLIAFERCHIGVGRAIIWFICFMNFIVHKDRDISLLSSKEIILNLIGRDKAVVDLFNMLSKDLILESSSELAMVITGIDTYYKKPWHKWRADLIHTYFRNPWVTVSVIAAVILFTLTTLQTVFGIYDFKHK